MLLPKRGPGEVPAEAKTGFRPWWTRDCGPSGPCLLGFCGERGGERAVQRPLSRGELGHRPASDAAALALGLRGTRWGVESRQKLAPAPPPKGSRVCFLCPDLLGLEIAGSPTAGVNTSLQRFRGIWTTVSPRIGLVESTEWALISWGSKDVNFWYPGENKKGSGQDR